ncbi:prepilin peptidase [Campylobacter hepaticus]|uniref:prepilin peptidase n=1 Tax=Campylobacter hepaticus TaxID=1813019 RepID=UPI0029BBA56B|nr:prepilin peptidase [Campylobacter hepaticus]MDX2331154.1 prepilin peptidase [Campylobacter hepaticus]MDX2371769.1 prepilin peptidase [Campylobacter hepaticus]MDX2397026.1 prepilin peptidase [Campylobacter hepaticus]MDX5508927.1 prepilin peptidase [Campylobacter hepaticus]
MIIFIIILGACIGSFCASIASRIIEKKSLLFPYSFCFFCDARLKFYELIPIFSYIFLRARCSHCARILSFSLILNEILGIILLVLVYFLSYSLYDFLFLSLFLFNFLLLSLIDFKLKAAPQSLLLSAFIFALFYGFKNGEIEYLLIFKEFKEGFFLHAFGFAGFVFLLKSFVFYLMHFQKKNEILDNLGDADIIIMACIAGILGFEYAFLTLFLASLFILPCFIFLKNKTSKEQGLPMIPFLNTAFVFVLFYKNSGLFL